MEGSHSVDAEALERAYRNCTEGDPGPEFVVCAVCGRVVPNEPACEHLTAMLVQHAKRQFEDNRP